MKPQEECHVKYKCLSCGEECEIVEDTFDYGGTHCTHGEGGTHHTGVYVSDCCLDDYEEKCEMSANIVRQKGEDIKSSYWHDAGAYGRCSYCGRYSDDINCLSDDFGCDCGKKNGFSGSFKKPAPDSIWNA